MISVWCSAVGPGVKQLEVGLSTWGSDRHRDLQILEAGTTYPCYNVQIQEGGDGADTPTIHVVFTPPSGAGVCYDNPEVEEIKYKQVSCIARNELMQTKYDVLGIVNFDGECCFSR